MIYSMWRWPHVRGVPDRVRPVTGGNLQDEDPVGAGELRCSYPGCTRPAAAGRPGVGRRPRYCGQVIGGTEHNRQNARNARLALQNAGASEADVTAGEPVTIARAQACLLIERLETALTGQAQLLGQTLEQLHIMGDPAAVQAELASVTTSARAEAEQARAEAAAADQARLAAETARAAAEADREDADDAAAEAEQARVEASAQAQNAQAAAAHAREAVEQAEERHRETTAELGEARQHLERLEQDLAAALTRAETAEQDATTQRARAQSAETTVDRLTTDLAAETARADRGGRTRRTRRDRRRTAPLPPGTDHRGTDRDPRPRPVPTQPWPPLAWTRPPKNYGTPALPWTPPAPSHRSPDHLAGVRAELTAARDALASERRSRRRTHHDLLAARDQMYRRTQ